MQGVLKRAIRKSGMSYYALNKATGVSASSISRFMDGHIVLRLDNADALARHLGLRLVRTKRRNRHG